MSKIYSIKALISENGKVYKGILDFYETKCILNSDTRLITEFFMISILPNLLPD